MKLPWHASSGELRIDSLRQRKAGRTGANVSANVGGRRIWFESGDEELSAAPEAFGSAMLIPALHAQRPLVIGPDVCASWAQNIRELVPLVSGWWGYTPLLPQLAETSQAAAPQTGTALCFSGGVDSFYTLLRGPSVVDLLICAIGYDVKTRDVNRRNRLERSVRRVAAETGKRAVLVATNLRRHRAFRAAPWEHTHGGALAALGHVLSPIVGRLAISSSYPLADPQPWGSRWDVDPRFSSTRLVVDHVGAELWRTEKLQQIAHEELVRRHLRVCWENLSATDNCCRCEKCVRTMLVLETCGQLASYDTFGRGRGLIEAIDRLPAVDASKVPIYEMLLRKGLGPASATAVRRLLARSAASHALQARSCAGWARLGRPFLGLTRKGRSQLAGHAGWSRFGSPLSTVSRK